MTAVWKDLWAIQTEDKTYRRCIRRSWRRTLPTNVILQEGQKLKKHISPKELGECHPNTNSIWKSDIVWYGVSTSRIIFRTKLYHWSACCQLHYSCAWHRLQQQTTSVATNKTWWVSPFLWSWRRWYGGSTLNREILLPARGGEYWRGTKLLVNVWYNEMQLIYQCWVNHPLRKDHW